MNQIDQNAQGLRSHATPAEGPTPALVVALDGGLVPNRLADEAYWARMAAKVADVARRIDRDPPAAGDAAVLHPEGLAYSQRVLDLIADARTDGTKVYLVAPDEPDLGAAIAAHLGIFDGVWSSAEALQCEGHVYLGRDLDGPLWRNAGHLVTVDSAPALRAIAARLLEVMEEIAAITSLRPIRRHARTQTHKHTHAKAHRCPHLSSTREVSSRTVCPPC